MNEEKVLKWRLSEKPTVENLKSLVDSQIITKEEAKKIVLDESVVSQADIEEIKAEIKLLRKIVLEGNSRTEIIRIIEKEIPTWKPYWGWNQVYTTYCSNDLTFGAGSTGGTNTINGSLNSENTTGSTL